MAQRGKGRSFLLIVGVMLVAFGLGFVLLSSFASLAGWVAKLWPLFVILAGLAQLARSAVERKTRSFVWGGLLVAGGGLLLAAQLNPGMSLVQLYARYWPGLLLVFAATQLLRHYTHRPDGGPAPRLFRPGKVVILLFIVGSGVAAASLAASGKSITVRIPRYVGSLSGSRYTFTDPAVEAEIAQGADVTISNRMGSVEVAGGSAALRAILTKRVRAWTEADALETAKGLRLVLDRTPEGVRIGINGADPGEDVTADIRLEVPHSVSIEIQGGDGAISVNRTQGTVAIHAEKADVKLEGITGPVEVATEDSEVETSHINGNVRVAGPRRVRVSQISGSVTVSSKHGSVELRDVSGDVEIAAPFSRIVADGISGSASVEAEHSEVRISRGQDVTVNAPHSEVRAEAVTGRLRISSSHGGIRLRSVGGGLDVSAERSQVDAQDVRGPVSIETTHGDVSIKNFYNSVRVRTSYRDVTLSSDRDLAADVDVETDHGEIRLVVPGTSVFHLEAVSQGGKVRPIGFDSAPVAVGESVSFALGGGGGPRVRLKTSYKNVIVQSAAPVKTAATQASNGA